MIRYSMMVGEIRGAVSGLLSIEKDIYKSHFKEFMELDTLMRRDDKYKSVRSLDEKDYIKFVKEHRKLGRRDVIKIESQITNLKRLKLLKECVRRMDDVYANTAPNILIDDISGKKGGKNKW